MYQVYQVYQVYLVYLVYQHQLYQKDQDQIRDATYISDVVFLIFPNCSRCNISIFDGLATTLPATSKLCNFASSAISFQIGAMVTQLYLSMKILLFDLKVYFPDYNDEYIDNIIIIETCFSS